MAIIYKYDNENIDFNEVAKILSSVFSGRKFENVNKIKQSFLNSSHVVYSFDDNKLIGFARAISDLEWAIIYNVALKEEYQGLGIGKEIIKRLVNNIGDKHIFTYTHPRTISLYEHLGFNRSKMAFKYVDPNNDFIKRQEKMGFFLPEKFKFENEYKRNIDKHTLDNKKEINIKYINDISKVSIEDINNVLIEAFGHERDINKTKENFKLSQLYEFAYVDDELIGVTRLLTDGVSEGLLLNVAVKPKYQGYGIATTLINKLIEQAKGYDIFIHINPKALGFYNNSKYFKRYKTAFAYINDSEKYNEDFFLPNGYRHPDEYYNEEIKYYKGKKFN